MKKHITLMLLTAIFGYENATAEGLTRTTRPDKGPSRKGQATKAQKIKLSNLKKDMETAEKNYYDYLELLRSIGQ